MKPKTNKSKRPTRNYLTEQKIEKLETHPECLHVMLMKLMLQTGKPLNAYLDLTYGELKSLLKPPKETAKE